ncbi:HNH endonuclease, partial [Turicibacter sanguinis]|nr:HNH endonuclease [Turicibacter sanguinis]
MFKTLDSFYKSDKWIKFRLAYIGEHNPICADCQKFIIESKGLHLHHIEELTLENVNDANVSLNPDNIVILCHDCHNKRHQRFGYGYGNRKTKWDKGVYLVYGPPFAGKKTFVKEQMQPGDLVIELDLLYQALSLQERYVNPSEIKANVFAV